MGLERHGYPVMDIGKMIFQPLIKLTFTRADVVCLKEFSASHYDGACRQLSQVGGSIYGMQQEMDALGKTEIQRVMEFREIDLLAKVTEQFYVSQDSRTGSEVQNLHLGLLRALDEINKEYKRQNI